MSHRVIAGKAKGHKLKMVPGTGTRPIMDRAKEALFSILGTWVRGSRWLDLFAGTGSVGIEALSRGADFCLFTDTSRAAISTIKQNLENTHLASRAEVRRADAFSLLSAQRADHEPFEVIYIAPPQYEGMWSKTLMLVDDQPGWVYPDGLAIAQIDPNEYEEQSLSNFILYDQRTYGSTMLCFYERSGE